MGEHKLTWYGHGTVKLLTSKGLKIFVDPFLTGNPACPTELLNERNIDLILVTHAHSDHFGDTMVLLRESHAIAMMVFELGHYVNGKGIAQNKVVSFNIGGTVDYENIKVTMTKAEHSSALYEAGHSIEVGPPVGFIVHLEDGQNIYFAGDTDIFSEMEFIGEFYKPVLAVLPIDGYYNMGPQVAARAIQLLGCKQVLPIHHSTFHVLWGRPSMLKQELEKLGLSDVKVHMISPGEAITV
jgi:L-ascorbate metabolism protein UlaG (beta-lactamase superfamily)